MHHLRGWLPHQSITAPNVIRTMPLVHQRQTRNNNPFHILSDGDDDDDTVVASNCSRREPPPTLPSSDLLACQPRKRPTRQLVSQPTTRPTRQRVNQPRSPPSTRQPSSPPASPPPRVLASPSTGQVTAQSTLNTTCPHPRPASQTNREAQQAYSTHHAHNIRNSHC
jgi:hypothetical protein